jgi:predicted metal-dependent phosphoesterase TrpH
VLELTGRADLHMHTTVSDGVATARQMLDYAAEHCSLNVVAITDHDRLEASLWAYSQRSSYPFDIIPGVEVTTADGHVLALWVTEPIPKGLSLAETAAAIHEQNGIAILAHPLEPTIAPHTFWRYLRHPEVLITVGIDAVEIVNAGAFTPGCNWLAQRAFRDVPLPVTGSSDAHMPASIATGITRFRGRTAADLRDSLALGLTAAEGKPWHITVYLKVFIISHLKRQSDFLDEKAPSTHPTRL